MAITSTLTADEIVFLAWEMLGVVSMGTAPTAIQRKRGRQALNALLVRMPQYGYSFPQVVEDLAAIVLPAGDNVVAMPADFGGALTLYYTHEGARNEVPILIPSRFYDQVTQPALSAEHPRFAMITSGGDLKVWPLLEDSINAEIFYMKKMADSAADTAPEIGPEFHWDIAKGVAAELAPFVGRESKQKGLRDDWVEARTLGVFSNDGHGDFSLDYEE